MTPSIPQDPKAQPRNVWQAASPLLAQGAFIPGTMSACLPRPIPFTTAVKIHSIAESRFHPNREILAHPFFTTRFSPSLTTISWLRHACCQRPKAGWFGVDPDARRIGPRLVAAFRRCRGRRKFLSGSPPVFCGGFTRKSAACAALTQLSRKSNLALHKP